MSLKTTLVCLCLVLVLCMKMVSSRYLFDSESKAAFEDSDVQDEVVKRQMDSQEMAFYQYCLTRGKFDLRCRQRPRYTITVVRQ